MDAIFAPLISWLLGLLFPKAPSWVGLLLSSLVPAVVSLVESFTDLKDLEGEAKFEAVVGSVRELVDDALDDLPIWSEVDEEQRDRLVGGLVEWAYFIHKATRRAEATEGKDDDREVKRAFRGLRRNLRRL